ncbi:hypothetical protein [uncultured Oscillibacter sp.]|uniref:hypothetical protein n=1 Tax=uncultured Oscillibacter sp. TaxID=876091 RepID=UPI0025CDCEF8|nr:hypothetical protein [uncultured Oscillibacter sp.]
MKAERLFRVLGLTDPALVEEALETRRRAVLWKRWGALAACAALVVGVGFGWLAAGGFRGYGGGMSGSSGADSGGAPVCPGEGGGGGPGVEEGIAFMSYAGPVFPLAAVEGPAGLTAERSVTWDLAPGSDGHGEARQWGAEVTDAYVLRNPSEEEIAVTALYPFAGSFDRLAEVCPAVTVDGAAAEAALYAGAYSGGFRSTFGADAPDTMNLDTLDSWTEYEALLESGEYLEQALGERPVLDTPVTVYEFSDFTAPHEEHPAATQAVSFTLDERATKIFSYGFNGCEWDEGSRRYSCFVPDGALRESDLKLLVVLGEDIGGYVLQGYQDGGCGPGEEIEGVSCSVTRSETTLDAVLDRLCAYHRERYAQDREGASAVVSPEMYRGAAAELLSQYGALSGAPMDRYADGRLDDILAETLSQDRVLYLGFPVTVPAGGSAEVRCELWKMPSFDYGCSGSENVGLQGYDLVTRLGSGLTFTRQSAALVNTEGVELVEQDFGFDLEEGIMSVELDPEQEHYYMAVRVREDRR